MQNRKAILILKFQPEQLIDNYDRVAFVLGKLIKHSDLIKKVVNEAEKNNYGKANTRESKSVQLASFGSIAHNYIAQLLLSSKGDIVVDRAVKAHRAGQKPVIALTNILESSLQDFVESNDINTGDPITMTFADILRSALYRMYKFTQKTKNGNEQQVIFDPAAYGLEKQHDYMLKIIGELEDINLPVSPIDYIKHQLEQQGIKTGEITGRTLSVDYSTTPPTLAIRSAKDKDKNRNVNAFNSGALDAIILNASGSTGLSLHSSAKFADRKQRNMIMAQPDLNIAVVQQMFGRVLRSGQVNTPIYEIMSSPLAAERRPMMILSRKLQSLNANTTANNKGAVSLGVDFMNKYGDLVAQQFLNENPDIASQINLDTVSEEASAPDDLMTKLTGKMVVLSDSMQQEILDNLVERYQNLVDFLRKTGNYDLEITVHDDWDAITNSSEEIVSGNPNESIFQQPVVMKQVSIMELRNIRDAAEVRQEIHENLGNNYNDLKQRLDQSFSRNEKGIMELEKQYKGDAKDLKSINERKILLQETLNAFKRFMLNNAHEMLEITIGDDTYTGTITGYRVGKYKPRSPIVASEIMIDFAVTDTIGKLTIPFSRFRNQQISVSGSTLSLDSVFTGEKQKNREDRYVITGNLLRGLEYAETGKVVTYKTHDGNIESALLMPKNWQPHKMVRDPRNEINTVEEAMQQLNANDYSIIRSGDGLNIFKRYGQFYVQVPKAKRIGWKYYLDPEILKIINGDFVSYGSIMRGPVLNEQQTRKLIAYLIDKKEDTYLKKDNRNYSLKRSKQINPILNEDAAKAEYQELLDNYMYDPIVRQQVDTEADDFIQRNGGEQALIGLLAGGDFIPGNVHGMAVMQKLLNSKTFATSDAETKNILSDQYMQLGTRLGQMLNARRLGALTLLNRESIQAHINAALVKIDRKKPGNNVRKQIEENTGVNPDALPDDVVDTPEKVDHIGRILGANMASIGDKLYEYWINSILSGPQTQARNILGNTVNAGYELIAKRLTEALLNTVARRKDGATFGEFKAMFKHLDFKEAWRRAKRAWDLETTGNGGKLETIRAAIGGRTGRIIRMPGRALRAADEFAKAVVFPIETSAMAYREGVAKGLSGQELSSYIEEQLTTPNSTAAKWGNQRAAELTFTEETGTAIRKIMEMRDAGGWFGTALKYFFPFIKTPHNVLVQGIRKSPFGTLALLNEGSKIIRGKRNFDGEFVARTAEQVLAWSALGLIYGLDDDEELPFITGSSPRYGSAEQQFKANKIPPYSIRIGDTYYSYRWLEPLATSLALIADTVQALKDSDNGRDATQISKKLFNSAKQIVVEKSFLDSLGEISRVASDPEYSMVNWGTNFAASWVPNVVRQTIQIFDDNIRDYKNRAKGEEFFEEQFKILIGRTGLVKAAPKIDYFGREITKDTLAGAAPLSKLMRLIPIQAITPDENMNRAELLMWRYNQLNPDDPYYPAVPAYYFTRDGKKLYFSGDNYTDYATESGQLALKQINNAFRHGLLDENNPTKEDIELIKKIFSRARQTVKDKMYSQGRYSE